ncbi:MAG: hydroxyacylglutathione hydrolase [Pelagibacterales bacterium]|nr:hydroxyacylglutathione hydrolase [Pelagibacterales bacterium]OUV27675.1 MAG: hydroxyacylglutathione hydrolase [Alphaproteobacteria bacterium TMED109]RCL83046.1 MAG: hydroxyacylglutathione hydrolase [Alphaproteobacteria bacterium]|tara:strand:+ start:1292 stop:2080 length:789 start_codon:yes stop_codon:yes gene_type:complete
MIVEQIWTGNAYRNYNYLIACPHTGEAIAIDPLESQMCFDKAKEKGWDITKILNTHEHGDHTGGNLNLINLTGAEVMAHEGASKNIPGMTSGLSEGDIVKIGKEVELEVLDTPGHTMTHICLLSKTEKPALFSGDTLFNAGAGNCHNGGHPEELYETFYRQFRNLPDTTLIYPGHDYLKNNLEFTLDREPNNENAQKLLNSIKNSEAGSVITNLKMENNINTFFRLSNSTIIDRLRENFPELSSNPSQKEVFLLLRQLRNKW